jgi:glycosyltransferase involved in cell wall biosynthesis
VAVCQAVAMQSGLRVSVVLGTFNGSAYVEEQLESILAQSVMPNEIIVTDDGSTDATLSIIDRVKERFVARARHLAITVITHPGPSGVAQNFERGLKAASGDIVFLSDQDDVWSPVKIERMLEVFEREPLLMLLHSNATLVDEGRTKLNQSLFQALRFSGRERAAERNGEAFALLMKRNLVTGATSAVRRELVACAIPFPPFWLHDEWLAITASLQGAEAVNFIDEALIEYRQHRENQVGASRLTFSGGFTKLVSRRGARNDRLLGRANSLHERVSKLASVEPKYQKYFRESLMKLQHEQFRSSLPEKRLARLGPVSKELRNGCYETFGGGLRDAVRDVVQGT